MKLKDLPLKETTNFPFFQRYKVRVDPGTEECYWLDLEVSSYLIFNKFTKFAFQTFSSIHKVDFPNFKNISSKGWAT